MVPSITRYLCLASANFPVPYLYHLLEWYGVTKCAPHVLGESMPDIKAFVFDLDGVITDSAEYHYRAWKRLADEFEIPFTRDDNEQLRSVDRRESLRRLLKGKAVSPEQFDEWLKLKNDYFKVFMKEMTPADLLPGVAVFLTEAQEHGLKLGVASASRNAREVLRNLGVAALLDGIGDWYSVANHKPASDIYLWVAGRLDIQPSQAVAFEDAEAGINAAQSAGMHTVGLGPASRCGCADVMMENLEGVSVRSILDHFNPVASPTQP